MSPIERSHEKRLTLIEARITNLWITILLLVAALLLRWVAMEVVAQKKTSPDDAQRSVERTSDTSPDPSRMSDE